MSKPVVADNKPVRKALTKGETYFFCACGRSRDQPFCDGSHRDTDITPRKFTAEESEEAYLCQCKHTGNPPYCDGTHKRFADDQVGKVAGGDGVIARSTNDEPALTFIQELAKSGLSSFGHHGPMTAMGVPRQTLPHRQKNHCD